MKVRSKVCAAVLSLIVGLVMLGGQAHAASVSFFLDQSNENVFFPDGTNYLKVTIADGEDGDIVFTVTILSPLTSIADPTGFGIDKFGFNDSTLTAANLSLPNANWGVNFTQNMDGFGKFDVEISVPGASERLTTLTFSIIGIDGDVPSDYALPSAMTAGEGNVFFAAHVAGFDNQSGLVPPDDVTSAFFGGSTVVPIPSAVLLFGSGLVALLAFTRRRRPSARA